MNYSGAIRFWVLILLSLICGKPSFAQSSFGLANCDFKSIGSSPVETKIVNGSNEPITLHIPETYLPIWERDLDEVRQQLMLNFDPKTLLPFDSNFASITEDFKKKGSITIRGIGHSGNYHQSMNEITQQFIDQPGKILQFVPEENGLHRLEGDSPSPEFDIYLDLENRKILSTVVCERVADPDGIETCFSYLASNKYAEFIFSIQSREMARWREIKDGTEQLVSCFGRE